MTHDVSVAMTARSGRRRGRPVDLLRRAARRRQIVDAAFGCFAEHGFVGTTTTAICRAAGVGSSTLFQQFPTKVSILVAVIEDGTVETRELFAALGGEADPLAALWGWLDVVTAQLQEPRLGGFVRAASSVADEPTVTAALQADDRETGAGLCALLSRAQGMELVRTDVAPGRLAGWLQLLVDGFLGRIAAGTGFDPAAETAVLRELAVGLLAAVGGRG